MIILPYSFIYDQINNKNRVPTNSSKTFSLIFPGFPGNFPGILPDNIQILPETSTWLRSIKLDRNNVNTDW